MRLTTYERPGAPSAWDATAQARETHRTADSECLDAYLAEVHAAAAASGERPRIILQRLRRHPEWTIVQAAWPPRRGKRAHVPQLGMSVAEYCEQTGFSYDCLKKRVNEHPDWTLEQLTAPPRTIQRKALRRQLGISLTELSQTRGVPLSTLGGRRKRHPEWNADELVAGRSLRHE